MNAQTTSGARATSGDPEFGAARPARIAQGFELDDLLRIISERRMIIIGTAILGLVLGIVASLVMTPLYRATAMVELNSQADQVLKDASGDRASTQRTTAEVVATQLGLLRSESLARRVAQELNLVTRPEYGGTEGTRNQRLDRATRAVQDSTLVEAIRDSMLIKVSYTSPDAVLAGRAANAVVDGLIASNLERRYDSSSYARDFLSKQLAATKRALEDSERQLNGYAINSGIFRSPGQTVNGVTTEGETLAVSNLTALNAALNEAKVRRITAEQAFRNSTGRTAVSEQGVVTLRNQRAQLQADYEEQARLFKSDYPAMQELAAKITALDREIRQSISTSTGGRRSDLLAEFEAARSAENQLQSQVDAYKGDVQSERTRSIQYNILQREADTNRALYDALLQRYKEIGVAGGIGQSNVSVVDVAEQPQSPFRPNLPLNAAIGILGGVALGLMFAIIAHLMLDSIVTPADVRNKLHLPVLGVIPREREDRSLFEALDDRKSDVSEAYYSVRSALTFATPEGAPKSLLITSTRPGEGKSTSAYAIASIFARTGQRVLLIDADLRKPTFASSRSDGRGLAWLLGHDEPIETYIEDTMTAGLKLLPVGRFSGSPAELLGSTRLARIAEQATTQFDLVVYDGPPVLGLADATLLGALAEKTVLVIETRKSRTANINEMVRRLGPSGSDLIGVILTKVGADGQGYGYNYYSYSYGDEDAGGRVSSDLSRTIDLKPDRTGQG